MSAVPSLASLISQLQADGYTLAQVEAAWPAATPAPSITFGYNEGGTWPLNGAANDAQYSAQTLKNAISLYNMKVSRSWITGSMVQNVPSNMFTMTQDLVELGIQSCCVISITNAPTPTKFPTLAQWTNYLTSFPTASASGVTYLEICNEIDYAAYMSDTMANYSAALKIADTVLHAKGYKLVANTLYSLAPFQYLAGQGTLNCLDYIGTHSYQQTAAPALAAYQALITFARQNNIGVFCTEVGLHTTGTQMQTEMPKLWTGIKAFNTGIWAYFPLILTPSTSPAREGAIYNASFEPYQPMQENLLAILG